MTALVEKVSDFTFTNRSIKKPLTQVTLFFHAIANLAFLNNAASLGANGGLWNSEINRDVFLYNKNS